MSIFAKFSLAVGLILIAALSVATWRAIDSQRVALTREAVLRGDSIGVNLAGAGSEPLLVNDPLKLIPLAYDATQNQADVVYAAVVDKTGVIVSHNRQDQLMKNFEPPVGQSLSGFPHSVVDKGDSWDIAVPITIKKNQITKVLGSVHLGISKESIEKTIASQLRHVAIVSATVLGIAIIVVFIIVRVLVQPILEVSAAAKKVGEGDLSVELNVPSNDEVGRLVGHFNTMVANLAKAESVSKEKNRMESELNVANRIQDGLLPHKPPDRPDLDVAFVCEPAKELGGDFFDWFEVENGKKIGFVIADVSGKGVGAALHMTNVRNLVRWVVELKNRPGDVMKRVNSLAWPDLKGESFVTMVYMVYDPKNGEFQIASAGHDPVVKISKDGSTEDFAGKGMPVGIAEAEDFDPVLKEIKGKIAKGESLALYTDGITEAMDNERQQFGEKRMKKAFGKSSTKAGKTIENLLSAVRKHAAGVEQSDDITAMVIRRV